MSRSNEFMLGLAHHRLDVSPDSASHADNRYLVNTGLRATHGKHEGHEVSEEDEDDKRGGSELGRRIGYGRL